MGIKHITKKVWENDEWVDRIFYQTPNEAKCFTWLHQNYGPQRYPVTWWITYNGIWLNDKIYTHWKLCE
jgi:hypothetical protein